MPRIHRRPRDGPDEYTNQIVIDISEAFGIDIHEEDIPVWL